MSQKPNPLIEISPPGAHHPCKILGLIVSSLSRLPFGVGAVVAYRDLSCYFRQICPFTPTQPNALHRGFQKIIQFHSWQVSVSLELIWRPKRAPGFHHIVPIGRFIGLALRYLRVSLKSPTRITSSFIFRVSLLFSPELIILWNMMRDVHRFVPREKMTLWWTC